VIRLLIADDHPIVRQGVRFLLEQHRDLEVVGEAGEGAVAVRLAEELKPDVILLDLVMPGQDGVETIRELRRRARGVRILVLTSYHGDELIYRAIRAGALSYLLKDVEAGELVRAVRAAARGESVLHPRVAARVLSGLRGDELTEGLTRRELEVLTRLARGDTNREIAAALHISEETVKTHVSNLLAKLQVESRTQAALYALRRKLVLPDETAPGPD
jgi:two-component system, NarL family, response regulator LiaR